MLPPCGPPAARGRCREGAARGMLGVVVLPPGHVVPRGRHGNGGRLGGGAGVSTGRGGPRPPGWGREGPAAPPPLHQPGSGGTGSGLSAASKPGLGRGAPAGPPPAGPGPVGPVGPGEASPGGARLWAGGGWFRFQVCF